AHFRRANAVAHVDAVEPHVRPVGLAFEIELSLGGAALDGVEVVGLHAVLQRLERERAIQRSGVEIEEAQPSRRGARRRALARGRRAVDRDDEAHADSSISTRPPSCSRSATNAGYDVSMARASSTTTGARAAPPSAANSMAMRWSPRDSTWPP